jgi:hypothetical protein
VLGSLLSAKLAAAAVVTLGGLTAAAYAGVLPAPAQKLAHDTIAAPAARPTPSATPVGPRAAGHAAYGLCTAYSHMKAHGSAGQKAVAFRNLAAAAGGRANVATYCAGVTHPGTTHPGTTHPGTSASHPAGQPTKLPSRAHATHPAGPPATHPTGKPTRTP